MPGSVNIISPEGKTISVPTDAVASLVTQGYRLESNAGASARVTKQVEDERYAGTRKAIEAGARGVLRGATLGLSDVAVAALGSDAERRYAQKLRQHHGTASLGGEIVGALLTAIPTGGTSLEAAAARTAGKEAVERIAARTAEDALAGTVERSVASRLAAATPSGWLSSKAAALAERGAEGGLAKRIGYQAAGGALEGGVQGVGSYVSDVALGDRDLSAEGALGAFKDGALLGGGTAGIVGITESGLQRARALFPESQVTREAAEAGQREAVSTIDGMVKDSADLEARARAAIGDIKTARAADPEVQAHAARIRAEREAKAAAQRAQAEANAAAAQSRAEAAQFRTDKLKAGKSRTAVGTPSDGVPVPIADAPLTPVNAADQAVADVLGGGAATPTWREFQAQRMAEYMRTEGGHAGAMKRIGREWKAAKAGGSPLPAAEATGASDLERLLAQTNQRMQAGESFASLQAEGLAARRATAEAPAVVDDLEHAVISVDPTAAKLHQLAQEVKIGRQGVADWLDAVNKRADAAMQRKVDAGLISRDRDVLRSLDGGRDILGAQIGATPARGVEDRAVRSRLRNPYSDEELIAKAENNPTFLDTAEAMPGSAGARMTARDDLIERLLTGKSKIDNLHVEQLVPRLNPETGEILPGLTREVRPATRDDVIGAIERNRRDPAFDSYVPDDLMAVLRGKLDMPDDLERAIPSLSKLEKAEADLADTLGDRATPGSMQRAAAFRSAESSHAEARSLAEAQRAAAIEDAALPQVAAAANQAAAQDLVAAGKLPTATLPPAAELVSLPEAKALGMGGPGAAEKASKLADVAAAIEMMSTLGIPGLPRAEDIPLIGPVLGLYLKARAGMAVWKKLGGKLPASVEGTVASKAAATRDRMARAVGQLLETSGRVASRQSVRAAATAEVLSRSLFSEAKVRRKPQETAAEMWARHRAELAAAQRPGAIERVMRDRIPTGDPRLAQSLVASVRRKMEYLAAKMPRPPAGMTDPDAPPWRPTDAQAEQWARVVQAADDPAGVLERAASGDVSIDEIETVRNVYPRLYQEAQGHLLQAVADGRAIPYARRIQLGLLFGLPLTATQEPAFLSSMQAGYDQPAEPPPQPRPSANIDVSSVALLQEQNP